MASIAYICDIKMVNYHRLYGHQTMNFWRLTNAKQFTKFKQGDYLFFLAKGSEHPKTREKGLVGYGKLSHTTTSSVSKMWRTYTQYNGYESELDFKEAIKKVSKQNTLPKTLNGLFLEQVVFFNAPLYLSEIDETVSRNLESYMYLDKEGVALTLKILNKAKEIGINTWQIALDHELSESTFELDYIETLLSHFVLDYFSNQTTLLKHHKQFIEMFPDYKPIKEVKGVFYHRLNKSCVIPISNSMKDEPFFALLAKTKLIQTLCQSHELHVKMAIYCHEWEDKKKSACEHFDLLFDSNR
jgi:hypothetical protein